MSGARKDGHDGTMNFLDVWANWDPDSPPFVLDGDREVFLSKRSSDAVRICRSWQEAYQTTEFCAPGGFCARGDTRLHLGLLPMPFFGDLRRASVYMLFLNPGLGPYDYYAEYEVPTYRAAILANLKQQPRDGHPPFPFLDPQLSWHGGFRYWHGKLAGVIEQLAQQWRVPFAAARLHVGSAIACIQLLPYRSVEFKDADRWLRRPLKSVALARSFVADYVVPRVHSGEAIAIVLRKVAEWDLPSHPGVVTYGAGEARGAHLTPSSRGGNAILEQLRERRPATR